MHFSNRAFGLKTTRSRDYHRSAFRIDTNYLQSIIRANSSGSTALVLALPRVMAFITWKTVYPPSRCPVTPMAELTGLFFSGAIFDFLVSKIGQE